MNNENLPFGGFFTFKGKIINALPALAELYLLDDIKKNCVDINHALGIIHSMGLGYIDIETGMALLWLEDKEPSFENDELAIFYSKTLFSLISETEQFFQENLPLPLDTQYWLDEASLPTVQAVSYTSGYLRGLELTIQIRDPYNMINGGAEDEEKAQMQQTCLLLLSKIAYYQTDDRELQGLFSQLPSYQEIMVVLPKLLSQYGFNCVEL